MPQDTTSEQEQDDPDAEFVEIDPTARYGRVCSVTVSFPLNFSIIVRVYKAVYFVIKFVCSIFDVDWHLG